MARQSDVLRSGRTEGLGSFMAGERRRLLDSASEERREQMSAATRQREVFRAWNEVCANTREGQHVTGLKYLPETNRLLVYVEAGPWATELTMLREVIRARMAVKGVDVDDFIFKTSPAGYHAPTRQKGQRGSQGRRGGSSSARQQAPAAPLTAEERAALDEAVAPIEDRELKEALKKAMGASLAWQKGDTGSK